LANARPTPNRRRRETSPDEEARIAVFAQQAATLQPVPEVEPAPLAPPVQTQAAAATVEKEPKNKSYTFRMTNETLEKLRSAAAAEDRSIQWVFDKILLPALDK
jgi:hypothetical protein